MTLKIIPFILIFFFNFELFGQNSFKLSGNVDIDDGVLELNKFIGCNSSEIDKIKVKIKNNYFILSSNVGSDLPYYLKIYQNNSCIYTSDMFIIENGFQKIEINLKKQYVKISNQTMNEAFIDLFYLGYKKIKKDYSILKLLEDDLNNRPINQQDSLIDTFQKIRKTIDYRRDDLYYNLFLGANNSSFSFWNIYQRVVCDKITPFDEYCWDRFSDSLKNTKYGKIIQEKINNDISGSIGKKFPAGKYLNINTQNFENFKVKSKYTFVDFWFTGCIECIRQFEKYRILNEKYKGDNFELITVSADKDEMFKQWSTLRKKYNFNWTEYYDPKRENVRDLNILAYPTNYLINSLGIVIKKNIKPKDLAFFLEQEYSY